MTFEEKISIDLQVQRWLVVKRLPMQKTQEMQARSLGWEGPLEEGMATHSSILAWRIPINKGSWLWDHKELDMTEQLNTFCIY